VIDIDGVMTFMHELGIEHDDNALVRPPWTHSHRTRHMSNMPPFACPRAPSGQKSHL
jgi:hypothetical protein